MRTGSPTLGLVASHLDNKYPAEAKVLHQGQLTQESENLKEVSRIGQGRWKSSCRSRCCFRPERWINRLESVYVLQNGCPLLSSSCERTSSELSQQEAWGKEDSGKCSSEWPNGHMAKFWQKQQKDSGYRKEPVWTEMRPTPSILFCVRGILQAIKLEWVAYPSSRASSWPRNWTGVFCTAGGFFTSWATREAPESLYSQPKKKKKVPVWVISCHSKKLPTQVSARVMQVISMDESALV